MACSLLPLHAAVSSWPHISSFLSARSRARPVAGTLPLSPPEPRVRRHRSPPPPRALPDIAAGAAAGLRDALADAFLVSPPTWRSSAVSNLAIFVAGSPVLLSGLSASGFAAAYLLGTLTWRAFGAPGFLLVVSYFVVGTAVTKLKIKQKEAMGVAEKRGGRRGPGSVIGSSAAGCVCALLSIYNVGGSALAELWKLGFVATFCTKLSDTVSSEIGKAFGRTTYLVTTFKIVPRGTEGAISVEGTIAGILASSLLASVGYVLRQVLLPTESSFTSTNRLDSPLVWPSQARVEVPAAGEEEKKGSEPLPALDLVAPSCCPSSSSRLEAPCCLWRAAALRPLSSSPRWMCSKVRFAFLHLRLRTMVRVILGQHYKIRKVSSG